MACMHVCMPDMSPPPQAHAKGRERRVCVEPPSFARPCESLPKCVASLLATSYAALTRPEAAGERDREKGE